MSQHLFSRRACGRLALLALAGGAPSGARAAPRIVSRALARPVVPERAFGPVLIVVSVLDQEATLYESGQEILRYPVATGVADHPTPLGFFTIIQKQKFHRSNIYSDAPMPFMQRITWSGVALHEGVVPGGRPASHGCIRMPPDVATRLYGYTRPGAQVIIADEPVAPFAISHPLLATRFVKPVDPPPPQPAAPAPDAALIPPPEPLAPVFVEPAEPIAAEFAAPAPTPAAPPTPVRPQPRRTGHIAMFISRKTGKLYIRQDFEPIHEAPVTIRETAQPLGNHVFTALSGAEGPLSLRWSVASLPGEPAAPRRPARKEPQIAALGDLGPPMPLPPLTLSAADALGHVDMSPETRDILVNFMQPGATLTISDQGLGRETGRGTDFIVLTR